MWREWRGEEMVVNLDWVDTSDLRPEWKEGARWRSGESAAGRVLEEQGEGGGLRRKELVIAKELESTWSMEGEGESGRWFREVGSLQAMWGLSGHSERF